MPTEAEWPRFSSMRYKRGPRQLSKLLRSAMPIAVRYSACAVSASILADATRRVKVGGDARVRRINQSARSALQSESSMSFLGVRSFAQARSVFLRSGSPAFTKNERRRITNSPYSRKQSVNEPLRRLFRCPKFPCGKKARNGGRPGLRRGNNRRLSCCRPSCHHSLATLKVLAPR